MFPKLFPRRLIRTSLLGALLGTLMGTSQPAGASPEEPLPRFRPLPDPSVLTSTATYVSWKEEKLVRSRMLRSEIQRQHRDAINLDGQSYYDSIATLNRDLVNRCSREANRTHAPRSRVDVSYSRSDACRVRKNWWDLNQVIRAGYRIAPSRDGRILLGVHVRAEMEPAIPSHRKLEMDMAFRSCGAKIEALWARYGVDLRLSLDTSHNLKFASRPDFSPRMIDAQGRSNTETYYFQGLPETGPRAACEGLYDLLKKSRTSSQKEEEGEGREEYCRPARNDELCRMVAHELGHYLGFPDRYVEDTCPDRETLFVPDFKLPWNLMADPLSLSWEQTEVYPADIRILLAPLCPGI